MESDPAFDGAGKDAGLESWRVENKLMVRQPNETHGKLYSGDSYIFLSTKVTTAGGFSWDIFFWLGSDSSTDEIGIAAYKTVELDDAIGGGPVQHRECQGHESGQFMALFRAQGGVQYLDGGVESGFVKVERDVYRTRLLQLKGRRVPRCREVPCTLASLNPGDVFLLDMGLSLYLWNGPTANRQEKLKGAQLARRVRNEERGGRAKITLLDDEPAADGFWEALEGAAPPFPCALPEQAAGGGGDSDDEEESAAARETSLHRVSDASGELVTVCVHGAAMSEAAQGASIALKRRLLDPDDVFILDVGSELFVWIGRDCTKAEKSEGMRYATEFLEQDGGRPAWTPISRLVQGGEPSIFRSHFHNWDADGYAGEEAPSVARAALQLGHVSSGVAKVEQKDIDFGALASAQPREEVDAIAPGDGKLPQPRLMILHAYH